MVEPDLEQRLAIALDHFHDTLRFYRDGLGIRVFRKHLGWYVENAPWPTNPDARRAAKSALCRLASPREVEAALTAHWRGEPIGAPPSSSAMRQGSQRSACRD